jgi:cysteine desulfurase / selenocysteine lyase
MQTDEIRTWRADTPGTGEHIHFNNAGAALPPYIVLDTVIRYLQEEAMQGGYETEAKYSAELKNVYTLIARLINAHPDEIAIMESATTGWQLAFNGIDFQPGDEVIISEMEYITNHLGFLNLQTNKQIRTIVIPNDADGNFDLRKLEQAITPKTKLIAITHIASTAGNILPVEAIGKIARRHNVLYLVDACQSVGQLPLDVEAIGCDMLSVTGRKFLRAPRGTGFLYVRKAVQSRLRLFFLGDKSLIWVDEKGFEFQDNALRFELYEKNRALQLGLGAAISYALEIGLDRIESRVTELAASLRNELTAIKGVTVHDKGARLSGIVTFSVAGVDAEKVKKALHEKKINVLVSKAHSALIYMNKNGLKTIVRASVHYYNTQEEITALAVTLAGLYE